MPKKVITTINNILKKPSKENKSIPDSFSTENGTINDPKLIAEHFNRLFTNIGPDLASKIPQSHSNPVDYISGDFPNYLFLTPITSIELMQCINNLPNKKSSGHDGYCAFII